MNVEFPITKERNIKVTPKAFFSLNEPKHPSVYDILPKNKMFRFPPNSEEVAIVNLAGFLAPFLGWRVITVQEKFPDALYEDIESGAVIRVEFEKSSQDFIHHKHDPAGCDYIMCWDDTLTRQQKEQLLSANPKLQLIEIKRVFLQYDFELR